MSRFPPTFDGMCRMLQASKADLTEDGYRQLWAFHQLLRERNDDGDLTRLRAFETMVTLHYVDCILVAKKLGNSLPSPLVDIGAGAGFPGLPLKIALPGLELIEAEHRIRRVRFMDEAIAKLGLQGIHTWHGKVGPSFPEPVQGLVTRALEKIPVTLARARSFVPPGGLAVFMKGPNCDDEIAEAQRDLGRAWRLEQDLAYDLPMSTHRRRLVTFRRLEDPSEVARRRTRRLDSPANESFKELKGLLTSRGVRKAGATLLSGSKLVPEALRDFPGRCLELLVPVDQEHVPPEAPPDLPVTVLGAALFRELDVAGTHAPLLRIRVDEPAPWDGRLPPGGGGAGCVLAVPFQDPENVGAVLRSAAAFGVEDVVLLQDAASPWHPKALRAGGTAALRLRLWRGGTLQDLADQAGGQLVALSAEGKPLTSFTFPETFLLLPGQEGGGLPADLRGRSLAIPMAEGSESLNAATATAVALYHWFVQAGSTDLEVD